MTIARNTLGPILGAENDVDQNIGVRMSHGNVVPPGLVLGRYTVHGLTPMANIVAPLRGWNRIIQNSSRSGDLNLAFVG